MTVTGTWPGLRPGDLGELVRALQYLLTDAGRVVAADGTYGSATTKAVRTYRAHHRLPVVDVVDDALWTRLTVGVDRPMKRPAVRAAQTLLALRGHGIAADGVYGPATETNMRAFQDDRGVAVDGVVGPVTWYTLVTGFAVHFSDGREAAADLVAAWRAGDVARGRRNTPSATVAALFAAPPPPDLVDGGCVTTGDGTDCTWSGAAGTLVAHTEAIPQVGFHTQSVRLDPPSGAPLRVRGPMWTADTRVVTLADPRSAPALRALYAVPAPAASAAPELRPGTLLALVVVERVVVTPVPGADFVWESTSPAGAVGPLGLDAIRDGLAAGELTLLLLTTSPDAWTGPTPPSATCVGGDLGLDRLTARGDAASALRGALGLGPTDPTGPDPGERDGAAGLPGALSVHASGLSVLGTVRLPWESAPTASLFQVARLHPSTSGPGLRIDVEPDRLTSAERDALLGAWRRLGDLVDPGRASPASGGPRWANLQLADAGAVPRMFWDLPSWPAPPEGPPLRLAPGELAIVLTDRHPDDRAHPPSSLARVAVARVEIRRDGTSVRIDVGAGSAGPPAARWEYVGSRDDDGRWSDAVTLDGAALGLDPVATPRRIRATTGAAPPTWRPATSADPADPLADPVLWAFLPLHDGWAQLPVPDLTEQIYLDAAVVDVPPEPAAGVLEGAVTLSDAAPDPREAVPSEHAWRLTLLGAPSVEGRWVVAEPAGDGRAVLTEATVTVHAPDVVVDGLLWTATAAPGAVDALPTLDDWVRGLAPVTLRSVSGSELFPPLVRVHVDRLVVAGRPGAAGARLGDWSADYGVDTDVFGRFVGAGVLAPTTLAAQPPLAWRRHPTQPMVTSLPLTQTLDPPNRPLASRQLVPWELGVTPEGLPERWTLAAAGADTWPTLRAPVVPAREWAAHPALALVALSLPGLVLAASPDDTTVAEDPVSGLAATYRLDLPTLDEPNALATSTPAPVAPPGGGPGRPEPPRPLTRRTFADHCRRLADLADLAAVDAVTLVERGRVTGVVEPWAWAMTAALDLTRYPGLLTVDNADAPTAPLVLTREAALRGIEGTFVEDGRTLHRVSRPADPAVPGDHSVVAGTATTSRGADGTLRDQRGLSRAATGRDSDFLRTPVSLAAADGPDEALVLTTTRRAVALDAGGTPWQLWFRDLPVADGFRRSRSPRAQDVNDPEALSREQVHRQGYEWRLAPAPSGAELTLHGLEVHPLRLEAVDFDAVGVTRTEVVVRLQLPVGDGREQVAVANAVTLTFARVEERMTLVDVAVVDVADGDTPTVAWPLQVDGPAAGTCVSWGRATVTADGLRIEDARLRAELYGVSWAVALPPLVLGGAPLITVTVDLEPTGPAEMAPRTLTLVLDTSTGHHRAELAVAVTLPALTAEVVHDLLATAAPPRFLTGSFLGMPLPEGASAPDVLAGPAGLQLSWARVAPPDGGPVHLLPGVPMAPTPLPGHLTLRFTAAADEDGPPWLIVTGGEVEAVVRCRWGTPLRDGGPVFASSSGDLTVGVLARRVEEGWGTSFLVDGILEVTNLFSAPHAATLDGTRLTLPASRDSERPLDHVRHTVRVLFNQHPLPGDALTPGAGDDVFLTLAPGRSWRFGAVVEHELTDVAVAAPDETRSVGHTRWTAVQELGLSGPGTLRDVLAGSGDVPPGTGSATGVLETTLRARLSGPDGALAGLSGDVLLVDAGSVALVHRDPVAGLAPAALAYLPGGTVSATPSRPSDLPPSDSRDPCWTVLAVPFLGRLQPSSLDGLDAGADAGTDVPVVDPVLVLARQRANNPGTALPDLALAFAGRGDDAPVDVVVAASDLPIARTLARVDPLAVEESWYRLSVPPAEDAGPVAPVPVTASRSDGPSRMSRPAALRLALDPRRPTHPPTPPPGPAPDVPGALAASAATGVGTGWVLMIAALAAAMLPRDGSTHPAVTLLPAITTLEEPQTVAVAPYLDLQWTPVQATDPGPARVVLGELLAAHGTARALRQIATYLREADPAGFEDLDEPLAAWARDTVGRLAPAAPVALLRRRAVHAPAAVPNEVGGRGGAAVTTTFAFLPVPVAPPTLPVRIPRALRADPERLTFREGQCGPPHLPVDARDVELAPPQTTGVQAVHLAEAVPWRWGLSVLRVAVRSAAEGVVGAPTMPWWHLLGHAVQFRSSMHGDRPTLGLPPGFRAPPIGALMPVLPAPALPGTPAAPEGSAADAVWQPVLPDTLRYLLAGARPGAPTVLRHQIVSRTTGPPLVSGSVPVTHRAPRPVPLPPTDVDAPGSAVRTQGGAGETANTHLVTPGPTDEAFRAARPDRPARRLRLTLTEPRRGTVSRAETPAFTFAARLDDPPGAGGWDVLAAVVVDGTTTFPLSGPVAVVGPGPHRFAAPDTVAGELADRLAGKPSGSTLEVRVRVRPAGVSDAYDHELTFPLRLAGTTAATAPLEPWFVQFVDPEHDRRLASATARATALVRLPAAVGTGVVRRAATLSAERREVNPDSRLALRFDWGDDPGAAADAVVTTELTVRQVDADGVARAVGVLPAHPTPWPPGTLVGVDLATSTVADGSPARWAPGNVVQIELAIRARGDTTTQKVLLAVTVVAEPVTPVPDAAYALLRADAPGADHVDADTPVQCVRYAWHPAPTRIDLVDPEDLRGDLVRRRALFHLVDTTRVGSPVAYAVQKIAGTGSTHVPDLVPPQG